jgi:endonuclease-3 related protein
MSGLPSAFVADAERHINRHSRALLSRYDTEGWWPARSRFEVMAGAVLVQNTRWANVVPAVRNLRKAGALQAAQLAAIPEPDIAQLIRPAGCYRVKARRLKALAAVVVDAGGVRGLAAMPTATVRSLLLAAHGVGFETADAILAFAFDRPVFIADAYARRWFTRIGVCSETPRYEALRHAVETALPIDSCLLRNLHAAIVQHAQQLCGVQPDCARCGFRRHCREATTASRDSGR